MTQLAKIQRIVEQWDVTSASLNDWHNFAIDKETLNIPDVSGVNNDLPITGTYNVTYFVTATVLGIYTGSDINGTKKQSANLKWCNAISNLTPYPLPGSQVNDDYIGYTTFSIFISGHSSQLVGLGGTPSVTDNQINVSLRLDSAIYSPGAKFKTFIEIYAFGNNT